MFKFFPKICHDFLPHYSIFCHFSPLPRKQVSLYCYYHYIYYNSSILCSLWVYHSIIIPYLLLLIALTLSFLFVPPTFSLFSFFPCTESVILFSSLFSPPDGFLAFFFSLIYLSPFSPPWLLLYALSPPTFLLCLFLCVSSLSVIYCFPAVISAVSLSS